MLNLIFSTFVSSFEKVLAFYYKCAKEFLVLVPRTADIQNLSAETMVILQSFTKQLIKVPNERLLLPIKPNFSCFLSAY